MHLTSFHRRNLGGGQGGGGNATQYFFNQGRVYLITELNNGIQKTDRKKKMKNLCFMATIFPYSKFDFFVK
jgi:hypothetical protein